MMNPVKLSQMTLAAKLRENPWFKKNGVQIVEQNKADLKFLMDKAVATLKGVTVIVGCDRITNNPPAVELTMTVTAIEFVPLNRGKDFVTAIDVAQAAAEIIDGEDWHFDDITHETPAERTLQATATFRGQVTREGE